MINTSTTAEKIEIMQAFEDGKLVQKRLSSEGWVSVISSNPSWEWSENNYRIKPQTVEEAADLHLKSLKELQTIRQHVTDAFIVGAQWQKEQTND